MSSKLGRFLPIVRRWSGSRSWILSGLLMIGASLMLTTPAEAAPCFGPVVGTPCYFVQGPGYYVSDTAPVSSGTFTPGSGTVFTEASNVHGGTVTASVAAGDGTEFLYSAAGIGWYITVASLPGSSVDALVPLHLIANASYTVQDQYTLIGFGEASLEMQQVGRLVFQTGPRYADPGRTSIFAVDQYIDVTPNMPIRVNLLSLAQVERGYRAQISVFADPIFELTGDYASRYTISGLLGAPNAVPEPATWAMMIAGLGAIGTAMRRRQQAGVSFA